LRRGVRGEVELRQTRSEFGQLRPECPHYGDLLRAKCRRRGVAPG
jgi:hypothetical protein